MTSDKGQELYANAIFKGFEQYQNNWRRRQLKEGEDNGLDIMSLAFSDGSTEAPAETPVAQPQPVVEQRPVVDQKPIVDQKPVVEPQPAPAQNPVESKPVVAQTQTPVSQAQPQTAQPVQQQPAQSKPTQTQTKPVQTQNTQAQTVEPKKQEPVKATTAQPDIKDLPKGSPVPLQPAVECYRIQFMSSASHFKRGDAALKGLWPVQCYKVDNYYRYTYGEGATRADLQADLQRIRKQFSDAFIVHFDANGKRIP